MVILCSIQSVKVPVTYAYLSKGKAGVEKGISEQLTNSIVILVSSSGGALFVEI